jgi:hypothetical protein
VFRSYSAFGLLSLLTAGCATTEGADRQETTVEFRSIRGSAYFHLEKRTISYEGGVIQLTDCSDSTSICLRSPEALIVVPRSCPDRKKDLDYWSSGPELALKGPEWLTGNVVKSFTGTDRFAYSYHPSNGLVALIMLPPNSNKSLSANLSETAAFDYRVVGGKGPLACR